MSYKLTLALSPANAGVAAGLPVYWQGIEARSGRLLLGTPASFGVYK